MPADAGEIGLPAGARALVVEDDEQVALMLCYLLEEQGLHCTEVATAEEGWRIVAQEAPDLAIVDLRLPGRDGWWLVERLREAPATRRLPIVVITGFLDHDVEVRAQQDRCECLGKPFDFAALAARIRAAAGAR
ncbi:MAG TPA: response regulator [Actinomycetota bacterium]|nr:response regulator [Actinomycetota bacterium]